MEGWLYGIYGGFGSGKTLGATIMMIKKLVRGELVFSNIKLNKNYIPNPQNYYFFEDFDDFYDVLAFSGMFAMRVSEYNERQMIQGKKSFARSARPRINVFFDETGIFANAKDYKELHDKYGIDLQTYILQCRKLFVSVYFIIQRPSQLVNDLRGHINYWVTFKPLFGSLFWGKWFGSYWEQELDKETFQVIAETKQAYDSDGNYYNYVVPQERKLFNVWWKPYYYERYDDLYLNKVFETKFKTDFLLKSWLFGNLQKGYIRNRNLLDNRHIYEKYFAITDPDFEDFKPVQVSFVDNPDLYFHLFVTKVSSILTRKYYFSDFARYVMGKFMREWKFGKKS